MITVPERVEGLGSPIQGVTLYSFTRAFHGREYDLEGLIRKTAAEGYGPGLEIIGFSSFRGFPEIDDAYAGWFRDLVDEVGLVTTSLAVNADIGIHRDRLLNQDELIEYMTRQIKAAAKLGFPIARVQISIEPDSMEALAPIAEEHGVTLALEVHADQYASHPRILALRDRYEKVGSPFLGFTMDWGATVVGFRSLADRGLPPARCVRRAAPTGRRPVEHVLRAGTAGGSGRARPALRILHRAGGA